ncbi:leader peptidase (prepilin peptidase) / N-methyltransferase/leader peptidase (prepilin peptidase) / N-methyltransferase [Oceanobacillus limi]|uniref:Leader peptidase (Prepilin peptidase) / N-methyltransferase/leader peptidase (Prepilin peptidase) / N-methyltransferase n=1 Tax=Oceanobacillus limi TaxID=930131 RepID=A0A1I0DN64_9BACI|nr:prepilin peptidase [Oceanobacillus limi]SET33794.1 leader peptidase (prepilin peptidase) / N-methyltransferase/leader peptidase (prepilin peptidase) / N-methyltransferase [Oceanobacillus limi]
MTSLLIIIPISIILLISTYTDLKSRLIYNWITFPGMAYFLIYHLLINFNDIFTYLLGFLIVGGICFFIAVVSNSLGGGDIKLFALLGLAFGWITGLYILFYSYLFAVIIALPLLLLKKIFPKKFTVKEMPMAPFITVGTFLTYF